VTEPVAGRQAESAELTALLDGVVAGRASALLLSGEAGIGKTSLVRHACSTWTGGTLIWAGCLPLRSLATPLLPLRSAFRSAASAPDFDAADRITAFDSWVDKAGPLVLVVDDLQWADPSTLDILMYVLAGPADRPVGRRDADPAHR
jgi:predicted ATPase